MRYNGNDLARSRDRIRSLMSDLGIIPDGMTVEASFGSATYGNSHRLYFRYIAGGGISIIHGSMGTRESFMQALYGIEEVLYLTSRVHND